MILRRVRLENIRSYTAAEIALPEGSVLLSGDIGSGKSTVLLAADFALFGIQGDLSGGALLRHGKETGAVELDFDVGGKSYTIRRTLKRKDDSVRQTAGHIICEGVKKDLTAQEAKFFILDLLGYPREALKKDSALLYRYTVYTPQEQMKEVIEARPEERLDLVRRLFGIDRYKRIAENAEAYAKELRGRVRELSGAIADLDEKKEQKSQLSKDAEKEKEALKGLKEKVTLQDAAVKKKRKELDELQERIEAINKKKEAYASLKSEFEALKGEGARIRASHDEIGPKIEAMQKKTDVFKGFKKPSLTKKELDVKVSSLERSEKEKITRAASLETEIRSLSAILEKGVCGTCHQKVADKESFKKGIDEKQAEVQKLSKEQSDLRAQIEFLRKSAADIQRYDLLARENELNEERKKDLLELKARHKRDYEANQAKLKALAERINALALELKGDEASREFKEKQKEYEDMRAAKEELQRQESSLSQRVTGLKERIESLESEIKKKEETKKKLEEYKSYASWLGDFFTRLMGTIEKHVLVSVQHEFNSLFQKWFSMLVMDEGLSARVDDNFAVVVEQDGFETEYAFMSGGERTAVALAYRLALNRVINDLMEKIRTKDLLILDEPTDGFSSDQMNSVRDVLGELDTKQTIIVSHEPKIESFVDTTIRFVKEGGISRAISS